MAWKKTSVKHHLGNIIIILPHRVKMLPDGLCLNVLPLPLLNYKFQIQWALVNPRRNRYYFLFLLMEIGERNLHDCVICPWVHESVARVFPWNTFILLSLISCYLLFPLLSSMFLSCYYNTAVIFVVLCMYSQLCLSQIQITSVESQKGAINIQRYSVETRRALLP